MLACSQTRGGRAAAAIASPDDARRSHARVHDLAPVRGGVAAVHAAAREVDDDVAAVDLAPPVAPAVAPSHATTRQGCRSRPPAEHDDFVTVGVKGAGEDGADLAGAAGNDDFHALPGYGCAVEPPGSNISEHVH